MERSLELCSSLEPLKIVQHSYYNGLTIPAHYLMKEFFFMVFSSDHYDDPST